MEIKCEPAAFAASSEAFGDACSTVWQWQRYSRYLPARFFGCAPTQGASQTLWLSPRLNQALVYPIARGLIGKRGGHNPSVPGSSPGGPTNFLSSIMRKSVARKLLQKFPTIQSLYLCTDLVVD